MLGAVLVPGVCLGGARLLILGLLDQYLVGASSRRILPFLRLDGIQSLSLSI